LGETSQKKTEEAYETVNKNNNILYYYQLRYNTKNPYHIAL